jgi:hypothetical protein
MNGAALVLLLCAVACPIGMGLMMLFMRKSHTGHARHQPEQATDADEPAE